jgi:protein arginine kinase activator
LLAVRKSGRVGCPECYDLFREFLEPLLKRVHGVLQHRGLAPGSLSENARRREERMRLREDLRHAIEAEDYETAARLRDRLEDQGPEGLGSESS